jgi:hypothetical protein
LGDQVKALFYPWEQRAFISPNRPDEIIHTVDEMLTLHRPRWRGRTSGNHFFIHRYSRWTSAKLVASGVVRSTGEGSSIVVIFRPPALAIMVFLATVTIAIAGTCAGVSQGRFASFTLWLLPVVEWIVVVMAFRLESAPAEQLLKSIFAEPPVGPAHLE